MGYQAKLMHVYWFSIHRLQDDKSRCAQLSSSGPGFMAKTKSAWTKGVEKFYNVGYSLEEKKGKECKTIASGKPC